MTTTYYTGQPVLIPSSEHKRVVVIGGGFAGISLVKALRKVPVQVVLLDRNNFHMFQPLLYQVATGGIEPDNITFPLRKMFYGNKRFVFRMAEVQEIKPEKNLVITDIGFLHYDFLVLATGSENNFYRNRQLEQYAVGLKTIRESLDIRSLLLQNLEKAVNTSDPAEKRRLTTFVVAGGGPAGVEMAGALAEFREHIFVKDYPEMKPDTFRVYLVEGGSRLLANMDRKLSVYALQQLARMKVNVLLHSMVHSYDGERVLLNHDREIASRVLIWTAGVKGKPVKGLDPSVITHSGRIHTDAYHRIKSYPDIFAVGDIAFTEEEAYPEGHPMVAQAAIQQGENLAANISRILHGDKPEAFRYRNKGILATIGRKRAVAETGRHKWKGLAAWWLWSVIHLFSISGFRNKLLVGINWTWNYLTFDMGNRLIIRKYNKTIVHKISLS